MLNWIAGRGPNCHHNERLHKHRAAQANGEEPARLVFRLSSCLGRESGEGLWLLAKGHGPLFLSAAFNSFRTNVFEDG